MPDPKTTPATPAAKPPRGTVPKYTPKKRAAAPGAAYPPPAAAPGKTPDKPVPPYVPAAPATASVFGSMMGTGGAASVSVSANGKPGKYLARKRAPEPEPPPPPPPPPRHAPVTPGTPVASTVHVRVSGVEHDPAAPSSAAPNALQWGRPLASAPSPEALPSPDPIDAAAAASLASAAARLST